MRRRSLVLAALLAGACSAVTTQQGVEMVSELAGAWRGRLAVVQANAAATMTVQEDGRYQGALHFDRGEERPFTGVIVLARPGLWRYHGTHGNGTVLLVRRGDELTLRFVPDGGGGGGAFTRPR